MNEEIITLNNVSKKYCHREHDKGFFKKSEFLPLNNISLTINEGEQIALLGKNGAGKTQLLKIISGIVYPSLGTVTVKKKVIPIFEYGTVLHLELTGRENIYLFGALFNVESKIVQKNFNDIVSFSEVGNFLDIKLRYYSTGMRFRLIFSIASFLNPEILILDDALGVGDSYFLQKVQTKLSDLESSRVTLLLTSHSVELLKRFCKRGIVMDSGKIIFSGEINEAIKIFF